METSEGQHTKELQVRPGHPCPTCGHVIPINRKNSETKGEKRGSIISISGRRGSAAPGTFEFCDGPLAFMIAPSFERRESVTTVPDTNTKTNPSLPPEDSFDGDNHRTSIGGSKRNSLVNFIRRLSSPFVDDLDVEKLEERRQSRSEKLEASVDKYCRFAKYE